MSNKASKKGEDMVFDKYLKTIDFSVRSCSLCPHCVSLPEVVRPVPCVVRGVDGGGAAEVGATTAAVHSLHFKKTILKV